VLKCDFPLIFSSFDPASRRAATGDAKAAGRNAKPRRKAAGVLIFDMIGCNGGCRSGPETWPK
jgi:hypothetical protein